MQNCRAFLKRHWLFILALLASGAFLLWKCRFGFGNVDESFYLTIPYRLFRGDALFVQEWHLSQMAGVLTLPFVGAFVGLTGSTEGLVLYMRYVTTILQLLVAVFLYIRLWKMSRTGAAVTAISYVLYIPFGIMAMSYNSSAVTALVLAAVLIFTAKKRLGLQYTLAGLCYAGAVLCCPYLAVVFILYLLGVAIAAGIRKRKTTNSEPEFFLLKLKGALYLTLGAAIAAVVFGIFVLSRASLGEIIQAFPLILDDPEHPPVTLLALAKKLVMGFITVTPLAKFLYPAMLVLAAVCLFDKKRQERRKLYFAIASLLTFPLMVGCFQAGINQMMWPLNMLAVFALLLSSQKETRQIFISAWVLGMLYAICLNASSNQGFAATASASAVSLAGSLMMIFLLLKELWQEAALPKLKKPVIALVMLLMVMQLTGQVFLRYHTVFWEPKGMEGNTHLITEGSNAGLLVTEKSYKLYQDTLDQQDVIAEYGAKKVLHLSFYSWKYLDGDYEMCGYSGWLAGMTEHTVYRLGSYYELNPDKWPDLVCTSLAQRHLAELFCKEYGYQIDYDEDYIILVKAN